MEQEAQSAAKVRAAFILGGARSGKSAYAQGLAEAAAPEPVVQERPPVIWS